MLQKLYQSFIEPRSKHPDHAEREIVLNFLLLGMFALSVAALLNTLAGFVFLGYDFLVARIAGTMVAIGVFSALYGLARYKQQQSRVAGLLISAAFVCACLMVYEWGLLVPTALLLFSLVIVMAGILLGARYSLYVVGAILIVFVGLQYGLQRQLLHPDCSWMRSGSTASDVVGFGALFLVIALASWLFNRQMELSLTRARLAESALLRQNEQLEVKVIERTRQLENEQLQKVQQMYRFAELGHVSTALFHDLANHLSTVSIDIENLQRGTQPDILERIDDNIHYIDTIVQRVRSQLRGKVDLETFDILAEIQEVAKVSGFSAKAAQVTIDLDFKTIQEPLLYKGDVLRFRQLIINLLSNAIEAYDGMSLAGDKKRIIVTVKSRQSDIIITVKDFGMGIPQTVQDRIFDPFYTSKEDGVGIGLFIVKQVIEKDLKGHITLDSNERQGTTFTVTLTIE